MLPYTNQSYFDLKYNKKTEYLLYTKFEKNTTENIYTKQ